MKLSLSHLRGPVILAMLLLSSAGCGKPDWSEVAPPQVAVERKAAMDRNHPPEIPPPVLSVAGGAVGNVELVVTDADGAETLSWAQMILNEKLAGEHGCYVYYDVPSEAFYLQNDLASALSSPLLAKRTSFAENSQCRLGVRPGSVQIDGKRLVLKFTVELKPRFRREQTIFVRAQDQVGALLEWKKVGTWKGPA